MSFLSTSLAGSKPAPASPSSSSTLLAIAAYALSRLQPDVLARVVSVAACIGMASAFLDANRRQ